MKEREAAQQNTSTSNLSPKTLADMAETKRLVESGKLPKYVGSTVESPSNPEAEHRAKRLLDFSNILANRKSRNEY
jgi:hypothetical protein